MPLQVVPFHDEHLDAAAALLAARHRADREPFPELPHSFGDAAAARSVLSAALQAEGAAGVVAVRDGRAAGYLIGASVMPAPGTSMSGFIAPRSLSIGPAGYAAEPGDAYALYRALYAALAPRWIERGCFDHYITITEGDQAAFEAWFSLGFGRDLVFGVRDIAPIAAPSLAAVEVHQAGAEDLEVALRLVEGLYHYHAEAPIYFPYLAENRPAWRTHAQESLAAATDHATFIAYRNGTPLALIELTPPFAGPISTPDGGTYLMHGFTLADEQGGGIGTLLLAHALDWAREAGYTTVTINWAAANIPGDRFWRGHGFRPLSCRLHRRIDERVAWGR